MDKSVTLKKNYEFRRMYAKGKSSVMPCLVVYCRKNRGGKNRLGITVGAKLGHAVVRNQVRRRLREIYRLHGGDMEQGYDIVLVARARAAQSDYRVLEGQFIRGARKLGLMKGEPA